MHALNEDVRSRAKPALYQELESSLRGLLLRYAKQLLPTYNIFDERRHFEPGPDVARVLQAGDEATAEQGLHGVSPRFGLPDVTNLEGVTDGVLTPAGNLLQLAVRAAGEPRGGADGGT